MRSPCAYAAGAEDRPGAGAEGVEGVEEVMVGAKELNTPFGTLHQQHKNHPISPITPAIPRDPVIYENRCLGFR